MINPLTHEQKEILNDYLNSGMNYSDYALAHNLKFYQVRYIHHKYLKLKGASNLKPEVYIVWLLEHISTTNVSDIESLTPWSSLIPDEIKRKDD